MSENKELLVQSAFSGPSAFADAQRMAALLNSSDLVPINFRGKENLGNAVIALELAQRIGASPLAVMQSLYIVHGKPSWSSQFIIAALNASKRFSPLRFLVTGENDNKMCIAWATELATGERLESPPVSIDMAKKEGWYDRNGSKWKTMPDLMLRYRAATFFGRLYAPDILNGMHTAEEITDSNMIDVSPVKPIESFAPKKEINQSKPFKQTMTEMGHLPMDESKQSSEYCEEARQKLKEYKEDEKTVVMFMAKAGKASKTAISFDDCLDASLKWLSENWDQLPLEKNIYEENK